MESESYNDSLTTVVLEPSDAKLKKYSGSIGKNFTAQDKNEFKSPDRKEEDRLVAYFQKTGDKETHNKLFEIRKSTIAVWARKYAWVCGSEEDLFSELSMIWLKCIQKYKYSADIRPVRTKEGHLVKDENNEVKTVFKRTPFNTFIFTSFKNHILNIIKKKYSKKRLDDNGDPIEFGMRSLDFEYGEEGEGASFYELYEDKSAEMDFAKISADWIIEEISRGDEQVQQVLKKFINDGAVKDIKTACKLKEGVLALKKCDRDILIAGGMRAHQYLKSMILNSGKYGSDFQVSNYQIFHKKVVFEIISSDESLNEKVEHAIKMAKKRLMV